MSGELAGRVAVVTGGTGGIGGAIARALAAAGASVVVGSRSAGPGGADGVAVLPLDVRSAGSVRDFFDAVREQHDHVDILVAAAGTCRSLDVLSLEDDDWEDEIATNLSGTFNCIRAVLPGMMARRWGRIISIASDIANPGSSEYPAYAAAKAGVVSLTRSVAQTAARHNVTCNSISPGWVDTAMARDAIAHLAEASGSDPDMLTSEMARQMPQERMIDPGEVASLAVHLCRDESGAITMQDIVVDGGARWYLDRLEVRQ